MNKKQRKLKKDIVRFRKRWRKLFRIAAVRHAFAERVANLSKGYAKD